MIKSFLKNNPIDKTFLVFIVVLLLFIPIKPLISLLQVQLNYSFIQFISEPWRIFSGHLVHASWQHLFVNVFNIILLRLVFIEWIAEKTFIYFICFSAAVISIGLWLIGEIGSYVGFSGIFHGLLLYLLLLNWKRAPLIFSIALVLVSAKIVHEQLFGANSSLIDFIGIGVAIDAHALGVVSGLSFWLFEKIVAPKIVSNHEI